jgi:hypothetical protein
MGGTLQIFPICFWQTRSSYITDNMSAHLSQHVYCRCDALQRVMTWMAESGSCALGVAHAYFMACLIRRGTKTRRERERERERGRPFQTVLAALSLVLLVYYVALSLSYYRKKIGLHPSSFLGCSRRIENLLVMEWKQSWRGRSWYEREGRLCSHVTLRRFQYTASDG